MTAGILWLTHEPPDPRRGGGALRQAGLLVELARRMPVDLVVAGEPPAAEVADAVRRVVVVAPSPMRPSIQRARAVLAPIDRSFVPEVAAARPARRVLLHALATHPELREASVSVATHLPLAPLLPHLPGASVFHPFHVVAAQLSGEADRSTGLRAFRLRRYASNAARLERWAVRAADATIAVSDDDAKLLSADAASPIAVAPNAVDLGWGDQLGSRGAAPVVLFPASLDYAPNADGARWLADDIWPHVRAAVPDARLLVVGRAPGPAVRALDGRDGIEVHGDVPDMADWLRPARVVVVPLRFGTGTRIKALEAMAARRPVVGTSIGLVGLGIEDGVQAHVADDPVAFATCVVEALGPAGDALVGPARSLVEAHHTWPVVAEGVAALLDDLARERR